MVLWRAISQWDSARELCSRRNKILQGESSRDPGVVDEQSGNRGFMKCICTLLTRGKQIPTREKSRKHWCLEHGFFAVMGGFQVNVDEQYEWILCDGSIVTPRAVVLLAELGKIVPVTRDTLTARSKADSLGKTLVCLQAGWIALQTIVRKTSGLPITLLELNTIAHVACTVIMYGLWWHKPQDVKETEKIHIDIDLAILLSSNQFLKDYHFDRRDRTQSEIFLKLSVSKITERRSRLKSFFSFVFGSLPSQTWQDSMPPNVSGIDVLGQPQWGMHSQILKDEDKANLIRQASQATSKRSQKAGNDKDRGVVMLLPGQMLKGIPFRRKEETNPVHLSEHDIKRLRLAAELHGNRNGPLDLLGGYVIRHPDDHGPVHSLMNNGRVLVRI